MEGGCILVEGVGVVVWVLPPLLSSVPLLRGDCPGEVVQEERRGSFGRRSSIVPALDDGAGERGERRRTTEPSGSAGNTAPLPS